MTAFDPLWVPLITHYDQSAQPRLDRARTEDHLRHITPQVRQYLIAGTTGDGWEMSDRVLADWLDFAQTSRVLTPAHKLLFGAFGATTEAVIERARAIERAVEARPLAATYGGLTLCAPVSAGAEQAEIADHFRRILSATTSPIAVYQLPQVVHCEIAPDTFAEIAGSTSRVTLFKDTSGADAVARSAVAAGSARLLRGAEGDYAAQLKPRGAYDGWLLSSANGFARQLRSIADLVANGQWEAAAAESEALTALVEALFAAAEGLPSGNPFSNANRAVDHVFAQGARWRDAPARLVSGEDLPEPFLARIESLLQGAGFDTSQGYRGR